MSSDLYVSLSGQMAMTERLATIANNVANMRTVGFKAEVTKFDTVMSDYRVDRVSFAAVGPQFFDLRAGAMEATGNPLDVAVVGDGFFGIETPSGAAYTRDGRFAINAFGDLMTLTGHRVLDDGGAPIAVNPEAGPVTIGADGSITQNGVAAGAIGLFAIPEGAEITRYGDSAVRIDREAEPVLDRVTNGMRQGYREGSNVNAITALTEMISVQRAYESGASATQDREQALDLAVRTLGAE